MKPSDFSLNTDYLSVANVSSKTYSTTFVGHSVAAINHTVDTTYIAVGIAKGAMANYQVSLNGSAFVPGHIHNLSFGTGVDGVFEAHRVDANTIKCSLIVNNTTDDAQNIPTLNFTIKESLFDAPDMV